MTRDYYTHTEAGAGTFARHYAEPDDRPSRSDLDDPHDLACQPGCDWCDRCPCHEED